MSSELQTLNYDSITIRLRNWLRIQLEFVFVFKSFKLISIGFMFFKFISFTSSCFNLKSLATWAHVGLNNGAFKLDQLEVDEINLNKMNPIETNLKDLKMNTNSSWIRNWIRRLHYVFITSSLRLYVFITSSLHLHDDQNKVKRT